MQGIFTLVKLNISDTNITDEVADDIAGIIYSNTLLQELDISKNSLQTTGIIKIAESLQQSVSTLKKLYINSNSITGEAATDIAIALNSNTHLQELNISNNFFRTIDIVIITKALHDIVTLEKFCLSYNNVSDEAADDIATVICSNTRLQEFDVSKSYLQSTGASKIAEALQNISTLQKLYINSNEITDIAADDIANAVSCNTQLQVLDISKNHFQPRGIMTIAKALQNVSTLKKLYISNCNVSDQVTTNIALALSHSTQLEVLDISGNYITAPGMIRIGESLQKISTLRQLYINNNYITDVASKCVEAICSHSTHLKILHFYSNKFSPIRAYELQIRCKQLNSNTIDIRYT